MSKRKSKAVSAPSEPEQPPLPTGNSNQLEVAIDPALDERARRRKLADNARCPAVRAAVCAMPMTKSLLGPVDLTQTLESLRDSVKEVQAGEMRGADAMLVAQADTLDTLFHLLVARSNANSKEGFLGAADTYMRLALKAQSQARATWESISKIKNPVGATFIRQANMANGPQQVNNGVYATSAPASAPAYGKIESQPNELKDVRTDGMDSRAAPEAVGGDTPVGTVDESDGTENGGW